MTDQALTGGTITRQELLSRLSLAGLEISSHQLDRWKTEGLLPMPIRSGRGRGLGREVSEFPLVTLYQAKRIAELIKDRFDFENAGWRLWTEGFTVHPKYFADHLDTASKNLNAGFRIFEDADSDDDEKAKKIDELIEIIYKNQKVPQQIKTIRKALKLRFFRSLLMIAINIIGSNSDYLIRTFSEKTEAQRIYESGFSFKAIKNNNNFNKITHDDLSDILISISKSMSEYYSKNQYNNYNVARGRIFIQFFRSLVDAIAASDWKLQKMLSFVMSVGRKHPAAEAAYILILPAVLDGLSKDKLILPAMNLIIEHSHKVAEEAIKSGQIQIPGFRN